MISPDAVLIELPRLSGQNKPIMRKYLKLVVPLLLAGCLRVVAQGTAFTYQGQLATGGSPATGNYDFQFSVYDSGTNGNLVSLLVTNAPVGVTNGLFTTSVDFNSGVFTGPARWLNIGVRTNGVTTNAYTYLLPRQKLAAVPYAIFSGGASNLLGALQATQLLGTVSAAQISGSYTGAVSFSSVNNTFAGGFNGTFTGNGNGLNSLNGSAIRSGTVADARLTANVALLNANQTFSGANTMSNWNNSFTGSFYGNGLVGWNTVAGNTLAAMIDHGYVLTNSQLVSVTLPAANIGDIIRISDPGAGGWQISLTNNNQSVLGGFLTYNNVNWNQSSAASANWEAIASSSDGSRLVAAILGGGVWTSHDYGTTWSQASSLPSAQWRAVASSADGTHLVAAVFGGGLYTCYGTTWTLSGNTSPYNWSSIASSADGSRLVACIYGSGVYVSTNFGSTWNLTLPTANWQCVASSADGSKLVAGINGGVIYYSTNGGTNWTPSSSTSAAWYSLASSADGSRVVAAVYGGGIYQSLNYGTTWTQLPNAPTGVETVTCSADGSKLATGITGGRIYLSGNLGNSWVVQAGAPSTNWFAATMSSDGSHVAMAVGSSNGTGSIYVSQSTPQVTTATYTNSIYGSQGSAVELQCIGSGKFMPVSSAGQIWGF